MRTVCSGRSGSGPCQARRSSAKNGGAIVGARRGELFLSETGRREERLPVPVGAAGVSAMIGSGTRWNSESLPLASTATSVIPAVVNGGFARPIWFSCPHGTSGRGLVRYQ